MIHDTQYPRTQLAWTRTGLSMATVGVVETRLLLGPHPGRALVALAVVTGLVLVLGTLAAVRLHRNADALALNRTSAGGRAPAMIAAMTVLVAALGMAVVLAGPRL